MSYVNECQKKMRNRKLIAHFSKVLVNFCLLTLFIVRSACSKSLWRFSFASTPSALNPVNPSKVFWTSFKLRSKLKITLKKIEQVSSSTTRESRELIHNLRRQTRKENKGEFNAIGKLFLFLFPVPKHLSMKWQHDERTPKTLWMFQPRLPTGPIEERPILLIHLEATLLWKTVEFVSTRMRSREKFQTRRHSKLRRLQQHMSVGLELFWWLRLLDYPNLWELLGFVFQQRCNCMELWFADRKLASSNTFWRGLGI